RRPEARRLLDEAADTARGWEALVIAEPQRAFSGAQFQLVFPVLSHHGGELWVPEVGGPVDPDSEPHDLVMSLFGGLSKAERRASNSARALRCSLSPLTGAGSADAPTTATGSSTPVSRIPIARRPRPAPGSAPSSPTRTPRPSCAASSRCTTPAWASAPSLGHSKAKAS